LVAFFFQGRNKEGKMLRNKRLFLLVAIISIVAMVLTGCGPKQQASSTSVNLNLMTEPPTADPGIASDTTSGWIITNIFMGLTKYDPKTVETLPNLALKWEPSADGLTWKFTLRKDVYWVRYDPTTKKAEKKRNVTAKDVEYGVKRALDPKTASEYAYFLFPIKNAEAYNAGKVTDANEVGVKALDDYTVQYTLESPGSYFPGVAGFMTGNAVPKEPIEQYGDKWIEPGNIWTCGAYMMTSWEHSSKMTLEKNPYWFDAKNVQIAKVNFVMVVEESTYFAMYENGELDSSAVPSTEIDRVKADATMSKEIVKGPVLSTYYYGFNVTKKPFDNVKVRQAFSYAFDRQKLIDTVTKAGQLPAKSFACPGIFGSPAEDPNYKGVTFDAAKAKQLLADAGYPDGKGLPEITLMYNTSQGHQNIAQFAQQTWKDVLGVEVKLANQEWATYLKTCEGDAPQIFRMGWVADYPDENDWVNLVFHSGSGQNYTKWSNPSFDKIVEDAAATTDSAQRKQLYAQAEQILCVDDAAIIPIYYYTRFTVTKPYLQRTFHPMDGNDPIWEWKVTAH
jgi:oligopeptide transport system substrate-binding protein